MNDSAKRRHEVRIGIPIPMGTHLYDGGVNFSFFSRHATHARLDLFDCAFDATPTEAIDFDPILNRTGDMWHIWVGGLGNGQLYGYRTDGPYEPSNGHRFNFYKLLLDPFAKSIAPLANWDFISARGYDENMPFQEAVFSQGDDAGAIPKSVFTDELFDWQNDRPLGHHWSNTVIYETHVRGFTIHPSSGVQHPGTYRGLIEKIPYLLDLGITAVELMPVQEFNENQVLRNSPTNGRMLRNYWGYDPVSFLACKASYSSRKGAGQEKIEFKEMVRALHASGIEVILDVVFNHTAETDERGPTICLRGFDNSIFYMLEADKRYYRNCTGTGNTINANHPVVRDFILNALRHWVIEMHVDGFRFDLASVLGRDESGKLMANPPLLERIAEDPILRDIKLIAEAWDAAGAYQVGSFSEKRWAEWNGRYRDDVRRFWRGENGMLGSFASRIAGSADIYSISGKGPESSINYITCHDGFTLNDLLSYREKHNEGNGEANHDGTDCNLSENCGTEGSTENQEIEKLRVRLTKNFILTLLISRGVPMLLGGDEFRRTQHGNNNGFCQDNETSWTDWTCLGKNEDVFAFVRGMIAFRRNHPALSKEEFYRDTDIQWFNPRGQSANWNDPNTKQLACLIPEKGNERLFLIFNASEESLKFSLPPLPGDLLWALVTDTFQPTPPSMGAKGNEIRMDHCSTYHIQARSSAILLARKW